MWKRILNWQMKTRSDAGAPMRSGGVTVRLVPQAPRISLLPTAALAAEKAGVATQREFAKMMW